MDDPGLLVETATFCKTQGPNDEQGAKGSDDGDDKRPGRVDAPAAVGGVLQICPDDLTMGATEVDDADPTGWYVRIVFDELLDPSVEELVPINDSSGSATGNFSGSLKTTNPIKLSCGPAGGPAVDVPYDGYYQPSGNKLTWPIGPSLFIQADDPTSVPTGATCTVTIDPTVIKDKDGNPVPTDQLGPYTFGIGALAMTAVVPTPGVTDPAQRDQVDPATPIQFTFNDVIDPTSISGSNVQVFSGAGSDCSGGSNIGSNLVVFQVGDGMGGVADPTSVELGDLGAGSAFPTDPTDPAATGDFLVPSTTYRVVFTAGATVSDSAGGTSPLAFPLDGSGNPVTELCFDTTDGN